MYNSEVKVLKLVSIPENGDLMFSLANPAYHTILVNGEIQINYQGMDEAVSHTLTDKAAIGVDADGMTLLVEVEGQGVTVKQLANVMIALGARYAVYTDVAVIKTYELLELEAAQPKEEEVVEIASEEHPKKKHSKKADKHEQE